MMKSSDEVLTTLKILIIGESGVGKSSLLVRFTEDTFKEDQSLTIGVDFRSKKLTVDGNTVRLAIWDTAGQERFRTLTPSYYRDAQGAILVYDVTDTASFTKLDTWLKELDTYSTKTNIAKMVVGNKIDKSGRQVTREEGIQFARRHAALFIESSARTSDGVQYAFEELVNRIIQTPGLWESNNSSGTVTVSDGSNEDKGNCAGYQCSIV